MTTSLPRITARVDAETQELLSRTTTLSGVSSINAFVVSAAADKAKQVIEREQALVLQVRDAQLLVEALDESSRKIRRLAEAAAMYAMK